MVCCMRVMTGSYRTVDLGHGLGYLHRITETAVQSLVRTLPDMSLPIERDWELIFKRWRSTTSDQGLVEYGESLGVTTESLGRLGAVYAGERRAWAFPMHDADRRIVGVRFRSADAKKWSLTGSKAGLFVPENLSDGPLMLCEGPTDTAAMLTLGFEAVGRPSCSGGAGMIQEILSRARRDVVIVADADGPGRMGAGKLAEMIVGLCKTLKLITAAPYKDVRQWVNDFGTATQVKIRVENASYVSQ